VGLGDFIRGFFSKKRNPELAGLESWLVEHRGVEGYLEPRTATQPASLLLVDRTGDHVRAAVAEVEDAVAFCERHGLPVYDAAVLGYPRRMREFQERRRSGAVEPDLDERIAEIERRLRED
jgi:hypothetical protein